MLFDLHHRKSLKESGDINKDSNSNSKGKNNGSPYEGGKDDEGNLGACDVFVAPDGEVTQVSHSLLGLVMASVTHTHIYPVMVIANKVAHVCWCRPHMLQRDMNRSAENTFAPAVMCIMVRSVLYVR